MCSVIDEPKVIEDVVSKQFDLAKLDDMILPSSPAVAVAANPIVNSLPYTLLEQANIVHTDHDYVLSKKRPASSIGSDSDDMWPTPPVSPIVHQPTKLRKTTGGDAYDRSFYLGYPVIPHVGSAQELISIDMIHSVHDKR